MLTNGAMFSTFKRADSHTVRGRPTRKDGIVIYGRLFRNGSFREHKIAKISVTSPIVINMPNYWLVKQRLLLFNVLNI